MIVDIRLVEYCGLKTRLHAEQSILIRLIGTVDFKVPFNKLSSATCRVRVLVPSKTHPSANQDAACEESGAIPFGILACLAEYGVTSLQMVWRMGGRVSRCGWTRMLVSQTLLRTHAACLR